MAVCWLILMITFPGFVNEGSLDKYNHWISSTFNPIYFLCNIVWALFITISTLLTGIAISKIFQLVKLLQQTNKKFFVNKQTMLFHCTILVLNCLVVIVNSLPYSAFNHLEWTVVGVIVTLVDLMVQLCICFICWTMGSSQQLRRFRLTVVIDSRGNASLGIKRNEAEFDIIHSSTSL